MYIEKQFGRLSIILQTCGKGEVDLFHIGFRRFIGTQYILGILNVKLIVLHISKKQATVFGYTCTRNSKTAK